MWNLHNFTNVVKASTKMLIIGEQKVDFCPFHPGASHKVCLLLLFNFPISFFS